MVVMFKLNKGYGVVEPIKCGVAELVKSVAELVISVVWWSLLSVVDLEKKVRCNSNSQDICFVISRGT